MPELRINNIRELLSRNTTPVSVCYLAAVTALERDLELASMDSEAVLVELQDTLAIEIKDLVRSKILAGKTLLETDMVYSDVQAFVKFANIASEITPSLPNVFNPANTLECAVAMIDIRLLDPEPDIPFSSNIKKYWGTIIAGEGGALPFPPFQEAIFQQDMTEDPAVFQMMADKSKDFSRSIHKAMYEHAADIVKLLEPIPAADGGQLLSPENMQELMVQLTGEPD